jgi:hypothetical protein
MWSSVVMVPPQLARFLMWLTSQDLSFVDVPSFQFYAMVSLNLVVVNRREFRGFFVDRTLPG